MTKEQETVPPRAPRFLSWWRRWTGWSNTERAWRDRFLFLAVAVLGLALAYFSTHLTLWQWLGLSGGFVLLLLILERFGVVQVFGPVLKYDLIRSARRGRFYLIRTGYLALLFVVLCMMYNSLVARTRWGRPLLTSEVARFAQSFFNTFLVVQFVATLLLTPAYTAGTIAEEKERKTLDFILATDLNKREIILGKLLSRTAHLLILLLGGLPVLCAVQFLGGVDPNLVLAGFALTGLTLASVAAMSILASVFADKASNAILLTYLLILFYLGGTIILLPIVQFLRIGNFPSTETWTSPVTIDSLVRLSLSGHPFYVANLISKSAALRDSLPEIVRRFALFHGLIFASCLFTATLLLRTLGLRARVESTQQKRKQTSKLPKVSDAPMMWKETSVERSWGMSWGILLPVILVIATMFVLMVSNTSGSRSFARASNMWVRIMGTMVACLTFLMIGIRAAGSIRSEYERETFASILATPLTAKDILTAKWFGSMLSVRPLVWVMVAIYVVGIFTGGLSVFALPLLCGVWICFASTVATLGLWCSLTAATSLRGSVLTLFAVLGLSFGHWFLFFCFGLGCLFRFGDWRWLAYFEGGLTPPVALGGFLSFRDRDLGRGDQFELIFFALMGAGVWALIGIGVWNKTLEAFGKETERTEESIPVPRPTENADE